MNTSHPVYDRQQVLKQIGGDEELLREVIRVFLDDGPDIRQRLVEALRTGNAQELRACAHCAKSAVGNFCSPKAVKAAATLEEACKNGQTDSFAALTESLCAALIEVEDALRPEITA